jgi:hypothetical protein
VTNSEIELLKRSIDKNVEIRTTFGEIMIAKIGFVMHSEEYDEHDVTYQVASSNMMDWYERHGKDHSYVLDFELILSVKPADH